MGMPARGRYLTRREHIMGKQQRFSRRDFLKFGAVGAAGAAAAGIVGCTPSGGATDEAKAASPAMDGAINSSDAVVVQDAA